MNALPICWTRSEIQLATQVDVGGLEVGDPVADAMFLAIHQSVPIGRLRRAGATDSVSAVTEDDVLADFSQALTSNEPHLLFATGKVGTGKSHLVRWLRSSVGDQPDWHVVYVEKRNTSLRRVIEQILDGIETPKARALKQTLAQTSSELGSIREAMLALLAKLEQLVRFDSASTLGDLSGSRLLDLRDKGGRLIGDYTFRESLSRPDGPVERITKLAMTGIDPLQDADEGDLHLTAEDLRVEPEDFLDTGAAFQQLVRSVVSTAGLRRDLALLFDHYLARAKAEVFTGRATNLLDVFEEVRGEVAARGKELCLFIEDLVLLHGIDTQLAQALTIPARKDLCRIRAVIAVTSGYLRDVSTFADRGVHYTMDVDRHQVRPEALRAFVARYFNAGRVGGTRLAASLVSGSGMPAPNACDTCEYRKTCHDTFGQSSAGHGLYPFNASALDRLIQLASPEGFDPRTILRQVIREPLEVAEDELREPGSFPSGRFASPLDPYRKQIRAEVRKAISDASVTPVAELSLRAFFAESPPLVDDGLRRIAAYFGVGLSDLDVGDVVDDGNRVEKSPLPIKQSEIDRWVTGEQLPSAIALRVRTWVMTTVAARLQSGPYGLQVRKTGGSGEWRFGPTTVRLGDVRIEGAGGGGNVPGQVSIEFARTDDDAVLLKGILQAVGGGDLAGPDHGRWFLNFQNRLARFEADILDSARRYLSSDVVGALAILGVQRHLTGLSTTGPRSVLMAMLRPTRSAGLHPAAVAFSKETKLQRDRALVILRDHVTQAKGDGAPSLFDAGVVLRELRAASSLRQLKEPYVGSEDVIRALQFVHQKQTRAMQVAWADVRVQLAQLASVLSVDEDLTAAIDAMDKLVDDAHALGRLSPLDARERYREIRKAVDISTMDLYRGLARRISGDLQPESLWDVAVDPTPRLHALRAWAAMSGQLLTALDANLSSINNGVGVSDRERLDSSFRTLADHLDKLDKQV